MDLYILMAQRKCTYPGEYAPEALDCMSESAYNDYPDYLSDARQKYIDAGDFDSVEIVVITVDGKEIDRRLFPVRDSVSASVVS